MKTYLKTLWRTFERHITRFLSIVLMVLVSVGFASGIGSAADKIGYSLNDYYRSVNASDFIVKDTTGEGFTAEAVDELKARYGAENVNSGMSLDTQMEIEGESLLTRLYFLDFENITVNRLENNIVSGQLPTDKTQAVCETSDRQTRNFAQHSRVDVDFAAILEGLRELTPLERMGLSMLKPVEVEICGEVQGPLSFGMDGEPSYNNEGKEIPQTTDGIKELELLDAIIYMDISAIPSLFGQTVLPLGDIYISAPDRDIFDDFSTKYKSFVDDEKAVIEGIVGGQSAKVITLYENYSFNALHSYGEKVLLIGYVLMVAFLFVTALVVLSTMTRFLDEERAQIGCLMTLGYSPAKIIFKYILFAVVGTGLGGAGAYFIGLGLAKLIYWVFNFSFAMPPESANIAVTFFIITFAVIVVAAVVATIMAGGKLTRERPANILRPKPPKAGKKVIIEKIPVIWNRLSFKYKSTVRNVLRYKSRFFMTVIAVAISTALVQAGLTLLDICLFRGASSTAILIVSLVIVFFAGLLTAVVIYTLTNINISERCRELATLMVLGYHDREVAWYIYREIFTDTAIGIMFGYPLAALIMYFLFSIMAAGTYATFMWAVTPVVVIVFTGLVTLMLRRKIVKIDMNSSLKAIE